jgi:hypothetical protein
MEFKFKEWLQKEMTSCASVSGGGTSTADVAGFARPIFGGPVRRTYATTEDEPKKRRKKHHKNKKCKDC